MIKKTLEYDSEVFFNMAEGEICCIFNKNCVNIY
ncbi:hypothetical protein IMSAGC018_01814 [Lachnospiraceae bacterium]|nr:hypothetical protein IMSAGC018_01814 [Lachnospiraceae bacterium]